MRIDHRWSKVVDGKLRGAKLATRIMEGHSIHPSSSNGCACHPDHAALGTWTWTGGVRSVSAMESSQRSLSARARI